MIFSIIGIQSLKHNDLTLFHVISVFIVVVPCNVFMVALIVIGTKQDKFILKYDKFMIIKEMQYLCLSKLIVTAIYIIQIIGIKELTLIIESGQILFCLFTSYIQSVWVLNKMKKSNKMVFKQEVTNNNNNNAINTFRMGDVLRSECGFGMFMRHCQSELNSEGLLFIVEVAQYKAKLMPNGRVPNLDRFHSDTNTDNSSSENEEKMQPLPALKTIRSHRPPKARRSSRKTPAQDFEKFKGIF